MLIHYIMYDKMLTQAIMFKKTFL